jgi:DNA (cytosine-5)-methyltransferase 1
MEQLRIIKEMREHDRAAGRTDDAIRPRFMVWENVPGAFSSNKGEDFRTVLEETARVADSSAVIPRPPKGKWSTAGAIMGDGWSLAWRVLDAQFWGVPQRRRRIALVADFGGECAPPILFERESVSGNTEESGKEREGTAGDAADSTGTTSDTVWCLQGNGIDRAETAGCNGKGWTDESCYTLNTIDRPAVCYPINTVCLNDQGGSQMGVTNDVSGTLRAQEHGHQPCIVFEPGVASRCGGHVYENGVSGTLRAEAGDNKQAVVYGISSYESNAMKSSNPHSGIYEAETARTLDNNGGSPACNQGGMAVVAIENHPADSRVKLSEDNCVQCLSSRMGTGGGNTPMVLSIDRAAYNQGQNAQYDFSVDGSGKSQTMVSKGPNAVRIGNGQADNTAICTTTVFNGSSITSKVNKSNPQPGDPCHSLTTDSRNYAVITRSIVRRLTPLECERLQGYPTGWTDICDWTDSRGKTRKCTDSARYKALGNSIALPPWTYVLTRLNAYCKEHTMASLFDGIGGFPLIWTRLGGACLWASEIEEFPIAVTKIRFG